MQLSLQYHHDTTNMTTIINSRVWSRIWDPGSRFCSSKCSTCKFGRAWSSGFTTSHVDRRFLSWSKPQQQNGTVTNILATTRTFPSSSFRILDTAPNVSSTSLMKQCASTIEKPLYSTSTTRRQTIASICQQSWRREIHSSSRRRRGQVSRRNTSSTSNGQDRHKITQNDNKKSTVPPASSTEKSEKRKNNPPAESHSYLHLPHLPQMPHRPTREELLAAATGFWSRLKVRFKWFSIRSTRPWNIDDWSAFASWFVLGNIVWVFVGTTTFFSLVIFSINTVFAQGKLFSKTEILSAS
jgi:distribution and morphology protein 31